jgi:hypothetical protein
MRILASKTISASSISLEGHAQLSLVQVRSVLQLRSTVSEAAFISSATTSLLEELAHLRLAQHGFFVCASIHKHGHLRNYFFLKSPTK